MLFTLYWVFSNRAENLAPSKARSSPVTGHRLARVVDEARVLRPDDIAAAERTLQYMFLETDIDIRLQFISSLNDERIESFTARKYTEMKIGSGTRDRRGLLLVYDMEQKILRIEVGYGLEGFFPDIYIGYLEREHTAAFFEKGDFRHGLILTLRMLHSRIRHAVLGNDFDPRVLDQIPEFKYLSGGAGATHRSLAGVTDANEGLRSKVAGNYPAGTTPEETFYTYLRWLAEGSAASDLSLFTADSQNLIRRFPFTKAYLHYILFQEYGQKFHVDIRGNLALQTFTSTPFVTPHLFQKVGSVWVLDIRAEVRNTIERVGGVYTWDLRPTGDAYMTTFQDQIITLNSYRRLRAGDNREILTRQSQ